MIVGSTSDEVKYIEVPIVCGFLRDTHSSVLLCHGMVIRVPERFESVHERRRKEKDDFDKTVSHG